MNYKLNSKTALNTLTVWSKDSMSQGRRLSSTSGNSKSSKTLVLNTKKRSRHYVTILSI